MKNFRFKAFTLLESLITIGIVAILMLVTIVGIKNTKPSQEIVYFKKAYNTAQVTISELLADNDIYPNAEAGGGHVSMYKRIYAPASYTLAAVVDPYAIGTYSFPSCVADISVPALTWTKQTSTSSAQKSSLKKSTTSSVYNANTTKKSTSWSTSYYSNCIRTYAEASGICLPLWSSLNNAMADICHGDPDDPMHNNLPPAERKETIHNLSACFSSLSSEISKGSAYWNSSCINLYMGCATSKKYVSTIKDVVTVAPVTSLRYIDYYSKYYEKTYTVLSYNNQAAINTAKSKNSSNALCRSTSSAMSSKLSSEKSRSLSASLSGAKSKSSSSSSASSSASSNASRLKSSSSASSSLSSSRSMSNSKSSSSSSSSRSMSNSKSSSSSSSSRSMSNSKSSSNSSAQSSLKSSSSKVSSSLSSSISSRSSLSSLSSSASSFNSSSQSSASSSFSSESSVSSSKSSSSKSSSNSSSKSSFISSSKSNSSSLSSANSSRSMSSSLSSAASSKSSSAASSAASSLSSWQSYSSSSSSESSMMSSSKSSASSSTSSSSVSNSQSKSSMSTSKSAIRQPENNKPDNHIGTDFGAFDFGNDFAFNEGIIGASNKGLGDSQIDDLDALRQLICRPTDNVCRTRMEARNKFAYAYASKVSLTENPVYNETENELSFTTADGIYWVIRDRFSEANPRAFITIYPDGERSVTNACTYSNTADAGATLCVVPNKFVLEVNKDGKLTPAGESLSSIGGSKGNVAYINAILNNPKVNKQEKIKEYAMKETY